MTASIDPTLAADAAPAPFAEALARAEHDKRRTVLTIGGRPVAAVVPIEEVDALDELEDARDAEAVREGMAEYRRDGVNWPVHTVEELAARWGIEPPASSEPESP